MKRIVSPATLPKIFEQLHNKKIVLVGGCFDILHPGHLAFLSAAKELGDILILLLESDKSVKKRKGEERPINTLKTRSKNLIMNTSVDLVVELPFPFLDKDYDNLVDVIKPAIIATTKGDPYLHHKIRQAKKNDTKIVEVINRLKDYSTTNKINSL